MKEIECFLKNVIHQNKEYYKEYSNVILPDVILDETGISVIPVNKARPNFITSKKVEGEVVNLEHETDEDLMDKIVMIPKADPGYEWIFTKDSLQNMVGWHLIWQFDVQSLKYRRQ